MSYLSGEALRPTGVVKTLITGTLTLFVWFALAILFAEIPWLSVFLSLSAWTGIVVLVWKSLPQHNHRSFGPANQITTARAVVAAALAGLIPIAENLTSSTALWSIAIIATLSLCMDGLDGHVARKTQLVSVFGARFDMETDAFLAFIIALLLWQSGKVGLWVLALGVMRYAFVIASIWLTALKGDLYPSVRRKVICVIQVGCLCLMLCPWLSPFQASIVGWFGLICLTYSFTVDILWLNTKTLPFRTEHQQNQTRQTPN